MLSFLRKHGDSLLGFWIEDPEFERIQSEQTVYSVNTKDRVYALYQAAQCVKNVEGNIAEVGVFRGGSAMILSKTLPDRELHLFDTFGGMPDSAVAIDTASWDGTFQNTSLTAVKELLRNRESVFFHPGFFPASCGDLDPTRPSSMTTTDYR